jgi:adenylylsulfate kinase
LYKKAREAVAAGKGMGFTGVDDPYEPPIKPEIRLENDKCTVQEAAAVVIEYLEKIGVLPALKG